MARLVQSFIRLGLEHILALPMSQKVLTGSEISFQIFQIVTGTPYMCNLDTQQNWENVCKKSYGTQDIFFLETCTKARLIKTQIYFLA